MNANAWMYDAIIYIYALSLLFYFSDFIYENRKAKLIGTGLLIFVWLISGVFIVIRMLKLLQQPVFEFSTFEILHWFSWLLMTVAFITSQYFRMKVLVFFVNVLGFAVFALNMYSSSREGQTLDLERATVDLLYVHISLIITSYVFLTVGCLLAIMYLILHNRLKKKKWTNWLKKFPSLQLIEDAIDRFVIIGYPLLVMALSIATISLVVDGEGVLLFDIQVLISIASIGTFGFYIYQRSIGKKHGYYLARLYIVAYMITILNMFSNQISSFH